MEKQIAFPVEKIKMLTEQEQQLLQSYKRKEKEANTALQKMYYTGRIHAFYEIADHIYQERLRNAWVKEQLDQLID
ncbi:hypothetical protein [Aquibacillus sediminis]|uniref:hypothetical protein n=1 Tax=Aquibacillus sediminis TaxID=2574734 RepID=UPI001108963A|nr:hypothetical protein [Aquibacillus sediminis]